MTKEMILNPQILTLKESLSATDYKAIKFAEGLISAEEYEPIKAARQELRNKINHLEKLLAEATEQEVTEWEEWKKQQETEFVA